ncbi:uncharacterized protein CBL_12886 [Carabus blaptoides fortunei]
MEISKNVQNLLANIGLSPDEDVKAKLCFHENLIISKCADGSTVPIGGISINIQPSPGDKYLVYVNSKFQCDTSTGGSRITAWVSSSLNTIEEKRIEYISGDVNAKQSLYVGSQLDHILVRHGPDQGGGRVKKVYSYAEIGDLVGEGANLVLMRLLALMKHVGEIEVSTMYITGDLCTNIYSCSGPEIAIVNNSEQQVCKIRRKIIEQCGIEHYCHVTLTVGGRLVQQEWHDCAYTIHLNPLLDLAETNANLLPRTWRDDMQLYSQFLDQKVRETKLSECYLNDSPDLEHLLKDYLQHLLVHKPEGDVIEFSAEFFKRYAKYVRKSDLDTPEE